MSRDDVRRFILQQLEQGPIRTQDLIAKARSAQVVTDGDDAVKAAIWDLAESGEVFWERDGRIATRREAAV
ncbi:MAG: hypothetical protein WC211_09120 [Dehalococcoidia bacterium]